MVAVNTDVVGHWVAYIFRIASGLRYDLAVEDPEYVRELVTHHVGGYLKIAPEHTEDGPLTKMMKPGTISRMVSISRRMESSERL